MEKLARKLANNISLSLGYDSEKEAVIAYGLIAIIQIVFTTLLVLLFGLLIGTPAEALIVCFSVSFLRKYSGGAHARTAEICTAFSVFYCITAAVIANKLLTVIYNPFIMTAAIIIIYLLSYIIVYKVAPVDSPNKPIRTEIKKKKMKKGSFIVLSIYFIISVLLLASGYKMFFSYGISLLFGVSWQIFTLTHTGAKFIDFINHMFTYNEKKS
ncbi:Accessory gene regulator protein B [bioreactor metagenome]|uniref:Accessory gene regulator protein B n=1 Tax=bioreactor metagenome TaxID=1076179 RepID=A0A644Y877_9ZZZZ|nr:accessory gene regulator B family protein [Oscillospiraceae bacterium]